MTDYSYRVHVIKSNHSDTGHTFIELNAPGTTYYYEINVNPLFTGPRWWQALVLSTPNGASDTDGVVRRTEDIGQFLQTATAPCRVGAIRIKRITIFSDDDICRLASDVASGPFPTPKCRARLYGLQRSFQFLRSVCSVNTAGRRCSAPDVDDVHIITVTVHLIDI